MQPKSFQAAKGLSTSQKGFDAAKRLSSSQKAFQQPKGFPAAKRLSTSQKSFDAATRLSKTSMILIKHFFFQLVGLKAKGTKPRILSFDRLLYTKEHLMLEV